MNLSERKELLIAAITSSLNAGKEILEVYQSSDFQVQTKADDTPLTIADQRAHKAIISVLNQYSVPVLSEEGDHSDYTTRKHWEHCWIVDPLDGTKEFIKRNDEFTVNVALIEKGKPIAGVIYIPVYKQLYFADKDLGAFRYDDIKDWDENLDQLIEDSTGLPLKSDRTGTIVVGSRSHMNEQTQSFIQNLLNQTENVEMISRGSSLKLCMIAEGQADVYPRYAPTMEWDIAAGHAIVAASGAKVVDLESGKELTYNKENLQNPWFMCKR